MPDLDYLRRFPNTCDEAVSRGGEDMPCEKPAVAARYHEGRPYAVCAYHTRGAWMVPLRKLLEVPDGE